MAPTSFGTLCFRNDHHGHAVGEGDRGSARNPRVFHHANVIIHRAALVAAARGKTPARVSGMELTVEDKFDPDSHFLPGSPAASR